MITLFLDSQVWLTLKIVFITYFLKCFFFFKEFGNGIQAGDSSLYINGIEISIEELNAFKYVLNLEVEIKYFEYLSYQFSLVFAPEKE